jgi:hypothetical protein
MGTFQICIKIRLFDTVNKMFTCINVTRDIAGVSDTGNDYSPVTMTPVIKMLDEYKSAYTLNEHFGKINSIGVNCKPKASKHTSTFTFEIFTMFVKILNGFYRVIRAMEETDL